MGGSCIQGRIQELRRRSAGADTSGDGNFRFFCCELVHHLWWPVCYTLFFLSGMETLIEGAAIHGSGVVESTYLWCRDPQGDHRALDTHAGDHVCRRRATG